MNWIKRLGAVLLPPEPPGRRLQLDGVRALAMVGVLYVHFWDKNPLTENLRVSLFFVVSGFLITHILWSAKAYGGGLRVVNFYIRRALRLFPPLAVLVAVGVAFDMDGFRQLWPWHLFQMSNFYFVTSETLRPWVAGHLWSLNIVEQFYLFWPLVILFLPLRHIYVVAITLFLTGLFLHSLGGHLSVNGWWKFFVFSFDPIFAGVLFYLLARHKDFVEVVASRPALVVALLVVFSPLYMWDGLSQSEAYRMACQPALGVIVLGAFVGYRGPLGRLLQSRIARFLSKISYGVYMYHLAVYWALLQLNPNGFPLGPKTFLIASGLTVIAATASWFLVEEPLSRLKARFPTKADERPEPAPNGTLTSES